MYECMTCNYYIVGRVGRGLLTPLLYEDLLFFNFAQPPLIRLLFLLSCFFA